jgi:hypothetical protein
MEEYPKGGNALKTTEIKSIELEMDCIVGYVKQLDKLISDLNERLNPVLRGEPPLACGTEQKNSEPSCPLALNLSDIKKSIASQYYRLGDIFDRIEL